MSVPLSRRKESRFEAQHHFINLRNEITKLMLNDFGFSYEKYLEQIEKYRKAHESNPNVDEVVDRWKNKAESFHQSEENEDLQTLGHFHISSNQIFSF